MKALKRFYGKSGRWYDLGDEVIGDDQKAAPKSFVSTDKKAEVKPVDKVSAKVSTKRKRIKSDNKNGKPKTEDK